MKTDFICGCAQSSDTITFAGLDTRDPNFEEPIGPCQLVELSRGQWRRRKVDDWLQDLALDNNGQVMALTRERLFIRPALDGPSEKISEPRPPLAADLRGLRAIGSGIYACGGDGLIFRRGADGWHTFAHELITPFPTTPNNQFAVIDGPSEDQIYILSYDGVFVWDGMRAHQLVELPKIMIVAMYVERPDLIWLCGWKGLVMRGSFHNGFARIDNPGQQMFLSVIEFDGRIYLAGDNQLWVYAGKNITRVNLGREKNRPIRNLTRARDALWAVGDDIFRLKIGSGWEYVPFDPPWLDGRTVK